MNYVGISCGHHDATITVLDGGGQVVYSGGRGQSYVDSDLIIEAMSYINDDYSLHYYERPWLKNFRCLWSGEGWQWSKMTVEGVIGVNNWRLLNPHNKRIHTYNHHLSHCAGAFQTSHYDSAVGVVIDAIGEWDTATIWRCWWESGRARYKLLWRQLYPQSVGLFYSAMTRRCGLTPLSGEAELMRMSQHGEPRWVPELRWISRGNLHCGVGNYLPQAETVDLAASTQVVAEEWVMEIMTLATKIGDSSNLVYGGGVAFNRLINRRLRELFSNIWIMPNPGDGGSSLGCAALGWGGQVYTPHTTK